jgi:two-component system CheB/CheR fusion protein
VPKSVSKKKQLRNKKKSSLKSGAVQIAENLRLKEELDATRSYLQSIVEEQRTTEE